MPEQDRTEMAGDEVLEERVTGDQVQPEPGEQPEGLSPAPEDGVAEACASEAELTMQEKGLVPDGTPGHMMIREPRSWSSGPHGPERGERRPEEEGAPSPDPVLEKLESLQGALDGLGEEFRGKLKYDAHKNGIIDKLHSELQEYKDDLIRKLLQPMILDVILAIDNFNKLARTNRDREPEALDPRKLLQMLECVPDDLENLLYRRGVDCYREDGERFNPKRQKVMKKIPTADRERDRTIATRLRKGYEWDGRMIRPEMVAVYVYRKEMNDESGTGGKRDE